MTRILRKIYCITKKSYAFQLIEFILLKRPAQSEKNCLYYSSCGNFGDELNVNIMKFFKIPYTHTRPFAANLCSIGSNLQQFLTNNGKTLSKTRVLNVVGSGFISAPVDNDESFCFNMHFFALRGKLSKKRCENILNRKLDEIALGDPGLLIKDVFKNTDTTKKYDVGIILHMVDKESYLINNIQLANSKILYIDVEQEPAQFVKEVASCRFILSSAMHGLICADSLGVPNKHMVLSDKVTGGNYKFRDYYSVFTDVKYSPVYLKNTVITNKEIEQYVEEYNITRGQVERICDDLVAAFSRFKAGSPGV